ncbi:MAG: biopolymer transporter ExbD, partial [bacterium]
MNLDRFRQGADTPSVPLTPLIDVLFLMIIFLVLGASFDQVETVRLPEASGQSATQKSTTLRLELHPDGRLWMDGKPLAAEDAIPAIRARGPSAVLLLPDRRARVGPLM